jgi:hypothetical protein
MSLVVETKYTPLVERIQPMIDGDGDFVEIEPNFVEGLTGKAASLEWYFPVEEYVFRQWVPYSCMREHEGRLFVRKWFYDKELKERICFGQKQNCSA